MRFGAAAALLVLGLGVVAPHASSQEQSIWYEPYLQLGDAPLPGFPGSEFDRIEIRWQTRSPGSSDVFTAEFRQVGGVVWHPVEVVVEPVGIDDRVVHRAIVEGLAWNTRYEYRVSHSRDAAVVGVHTAEFTTRLAPGDAAEFSFAAYGDSACWCDLAPFLTVQAGISRSEAAFALLLGDNSYAEGTFEELDARFRPDLSPDAAAWRARHIDHVAYGNHDVSADGGISSEVAFSVPVPLFGVTAPAGVPTTERVGHNYSFDYGSVHFATFDSNALDDPDRLTGLVEWLVADLEASAARWKIVFAHHPVAGVPDKPEAPDGHYYRTLVPALNEAGVDLLLVGHSHTYGWSYPLLDGEDGAMWDRGSPTSFRQGDGVVQVVSGVGGRSLRGGVFDAYPFVAAGFTVDTDPASDWGFALVDVTPDALVVSYVAAGDDTVLGSFTLHRRRVPVSGRGLAGQLAA